MQWWPNAITVAASVADRYGDHELRLTDASLMALAAHVSTISIATLDERHFRAVRPLVGGDAFKLLPADR